MHSAASTVACLCTAFLHQKCALYALGVRQVVLAAITACGSTSAHLRKLFAVCTFAYAAVCGVNKARPCLLNPRHRFTLGTCHIYRNDCTLKYYYYSIIIDAVGTCTHAARGVPAHKWCSVHEHLHCKHLSTLQHSGIQTHFPMMTLCSLFFLKLCTSMLDRNPPPVSCMPMTWKW